MSAPVGFRSSSHCTLTVCSCRVRCCVDSASGWCELLHKRFLRGEHAGALVLSVVERRCSCSPYR
jgi:hypothetical protein